MLSLNGKEASGEDVSKLLRFFRNLDISDFLAYNHRRFPRNGAYL